MEGLRQILFPVATAHDTGLPHIEPEIVSETLDTAISSYSLQTVYGAAIALGLLLFIAVAVRNPNESAKRILFWSIAAVIAIGTGLLIGMTVYLNQVSVTKGPVHWHADFEIWACGEQQDLKDPQGISNKIGTPTLHEHNDNRIHVEGVVVEYPDVNLGAFFRAIGGSLTDKSLAIPTVSGDKSYVTGQSCPDSNELAALQVFAITSDLQQRTYSQQKLVDPAAYQFAEHAQVPPGDCIIIEFGAPKERTDELCQSYVVAKATGKLTTEITAPVEEGDGN